MGPPTRRTVSRAVCVASVASMVASTMGQQTTTPYASPNANLKYSTMQMDAVSAASFATGHSISR